MRSKNDARINRRGKKKGRSPVGGKALQRLFFYLSQRDPALNNDVLAMVPAAAAARPKFGLPKGAARAKSIRGRARKPSRRPAPEARKFARAITKAANTLAARQRRTSAAMRRAMRGAAAPARATLIWQEIGPLLIPNGQTYGSNRVDVIGRISSIAIDPNDPKHILVGAAGGGIWESADTGSTWQPRTDQMPSLAIGAIAFDPSSPKKAYAGSGEGNFYYNLGAGLFKSVDGGTTWTVAAATPFVGVGFYDLVVDPQNPSVLYAATTNGFYKSTSSGAAWTLKRSGTCWDISVHANGGAVEVLAAFSDGLFVSTNAGNTFAAVTLPSAPTGSWGRLAVDRAITSPDIAHAFGAAGGTAHLWRRAGTVWTKITSLPTINVNQAWYDWYVAAVPDNPKKVYLGAIDTFRGTLSGSSWSWTNITTQGAKSIHPDQHCMAFSPGNSSIIYAGNDGGIYRSANSGGNWTELNKGLGITEIEYLASDPNSWTWLMGGTQDNGTIRYSGSTVWEHIADGDGGDCGVNQLSPNVVYHSYYSVSLERSTNKGNTWTSLNPPSMQSLFYPPVEVSGSTVAIAGTSLVITRTGTSPWTTVPLGLSTQEVSSTMRQIDANTILVGTNMGRVLRLNWTGTSWTKSQLASPDARYISCIAVDPNNPQRFWATFSQMGGGLVYRSDNAGGSWANCTTGLPKIPMNSVVVDPANFKRVWVAADVGVYETLDLGSTWAPFSNGLPNAMAADLLFHKQDRKLICGTRNRGAWAISIP